MTSQTESACCAPEGAQRTAEAPAEAATRPALTPGIDVIETDETITVVADMPGLTLEDIDVRFERGLLTVAGARAEREHADARPALLEHRGGEFRRRVRIAREIDPEGLTARYREGVLTVDLPKRETRRRYRVAVTEG